MHVKKTQPNPPRANAPLPAGNHEALKRAITDETANASSWVKETLLELKVRNKLLTKINPADALRIHIAIESQTVILTGAVQKPSNIAIAEALARTVEGVLKVNNDLTCAPGGSNFAMAEAAVAKTSYQINDALLETKVMTKLLAKTGLNALKIDVEAANGVVSLTGTVADLSHRDEALRIVRETGGVKRVNDQMKLAPFDDEIQ